LGAAGLTFLARGSAGGFVRARFGSALFGAFVRRVVPVPLLEDFPDPALDLLPFRVAMLFEKQIRKRRAS
jgi:hypothetical protein